MPDVRESDEAAGPHGLMGIERVADMSGLCEYAQTWLCEWLDSAQTQAHTLRGDWPPAHARSG